MRASFVVVVVVVVGRVFFDPNEDHTPGQARFAILEKKGRNIARKDNAEFYLHNKQGQIRERDSYGSDPYPPKG
jgi:hypothetical protein